MNEKFEQEYGEVERMRIDDDSEPMVKRRTEVDAVEQMVNPALPPARTKAQHTMDMLQRDHVECQRCGAFKHKSQFSRNEELPGRLYCHSYCKACMSTIVQTKRQVLRNGVRSEGYRYRERRKKRRHRK